MTIKKLLDGRYQVHIRPDGVKGKQIKRICKTKSEAQRLERELLTTVSALHDNDKLSKLADLWFDYFGQNLKDGKIRYSKLRHIIAGMGDYKASALKPAHYLSYRKKRLESGISRNTCNHDLVYLKTVFNKLNKAGYLTVNPLLDIAPLKIDQRELSYLTDYQIKRLLVACRNSHNESLFWVVLLCLRTGARWTEAETVTASQLANLSVTFNKTKSGKSRTVPLSPDFYHLLKRRYRLAGGRIFANCYDAFRLAVVRSRLHLPRGQSAHVLRHTYASHFVMNGGDILTLQRILGHSDVNITMQYAHLSPDHLQDAIRYAPI